MNKITVAHINIRQSISLLLIKIILLDIIAAGFTVFYFLAVSFSPSISVQEIFLSINVVFFVLLGLSKILLTAYIIISWINEYYDITPKVISHNKGYFKRDEESLQFNNIRAVKLYQSMAGRVLNYGTIALFDVRRNKKMELYAIHNPHRYIKILEMLLINPNEEKHIFRPHFFQEEL